MSSHRVPVLRATDLSKTYRARRGGGRRAPGVLAVKDVSLELFRGRITAVVGESGSGKSTLARLLAGVERPSTGQIELEGLPVRRIPPQAVQMVFQDPFASLNPVHSVAHHLARPLALHQPALSAAERRSALLELLERVHLMPAAEMAARKPHELSGGQRQRGAIARTLATRPKVILADEPVSMLDVSLRLGVLNLLADLTREEDLALLYITHDIASARYFADDIVVMYGGRVVEHGAAETVTQHGVHPYTRLLIDAAPDPDRRTRSPRPPAPAEQALADEGPVVEGCSFRPRCPYATARCRYEEPPHRIVPTSGGSIAHEAACWVLPRFDDAERGGSDGNKRSDTTREAIP